MTFMEPERVLRNSLVFLPSSLLPLSASLPPLVSVGFVAEMAPRQVLQRRQRQARRGIKEEIPGRSGGLLRPYLLRYVENNGKHRFGAEETLHITLFSWVYFFLLVLSDTNKRFLYDVGVYDSDEEDGDGMCDFLDEMAKMMGQASSSTLGSNSFESLQDLFEEMFPGNTTGSDSTSMSGTTSLSSETNTSMTGNKRNSCEMNFGEVGTKGFSDFSSFEGNSLNGHVFCFGVGEVSTESSSRGSKHKNARKANGYTRNP